MGKVKLRNMKDIKIAYIEHNGPYSEVPYGDYFNELISWAKSSTAKPKYRFYGIFHDDPNLVEPAKCRCDIAIQIKGDANGTEKIKIKTIAGQEMAMTKHNGPTDQYEETYADLNKWVEDNGYEPNHSPIEQYVSKPKEKNGKIILKSIVYLPVKKK